MKITTHIDEGLLKKVKRITGFDTHREVLEAGLRNLLADNQRNSFVKNFDKYCLDFTPKLLKVSRGT